jgi:hypothetical protein
VIIGFPLIVRGETKKLIPLREWVNVVRNNALSKEAPKEGFLTDAKAFAKLWKAWRPDEKVPEIDFRKQVVIVTLATGGPNRPRINVTLDDDGNVKVSASSTLIGGPGFGYSIATFERKGIKTIHGKPIDKKK